MTTSSARRFVDAIAARDHDALRDCLSPDVDFKGLTPGRLWEADSPEGVRDIVLGTWFEEHDRIVDVVAVREDEVADTAHICYRFDLETPSGPHVAEQQAYYRDGPAGISYLRILCSGFRPRVPATAVLGVDGCPAGWVGALLVDDRVSLHVAPTIEQLVASLPARPVVVGVDIPIGLPDHGSREADRLARAELPVGRKSSVFPTPVRSAVLADTWPEANAANRAASGKGLSHQGFNLCRKIAEVDAWVLARPAVTVVEVHPEVSFAAMGADTRPSKQRPEGRDVRRRALLDAGLDLPEDLRGRGWAVDDALDACAAAWTARRVAVGESLSFPDPPEVFSDGIAAAIRA